MDDRWMFAIASAWSRQATAHLEHLDSPFHTAGRLRPCWRNDGILDVMLSHRPAALFSDYRAWCARGEVAIRPRVRGGADRTRGTYPERREMELGWIVGVGLCVPSLSGWWNE